MNKIAAVLGLFATASIMFSIAGKSLTSFAPTIGWLLAVLLFLAATVVAIVKKKK